MSNPLVTVVIPTFTDFDQMRESPKKRLTRAIRSVLNQSYPHVEVLVCDDGTPDYYGEDLVAEAVRAFEKEVEEDSDITIRHLKLEHRGQSFTLNDGFAAAKGDYVFNLNDDDIILHDFLEGAVGILEQEEKKDIGFLYSDYIYTKDWRNFHPAHPRPEPWDPKRLRQQQIAPCIGLVRSRVAKRVKFDEDLTHEEDWDWLLRISKVTTALYVPELWCFCVYLHPNQKSIRDNTGVQASQNIIRTRIGGGYYD